MENALAALPDDPATLKRMLLDTLALSKQKDERIARLEHQIAHLVRRQFGRRSERLTPGQMVLFAAETVSLLTAPPPPSVPPTTPASPPSGEVNSRRRSPGHGRQIIPAALPRRTTVISVPPDQVNCQDCNEPRTKITVVVTERLEFEPAQIFVHQEVREVLACAPCAGNVVTAEAPPATIEKGLAGPGLLAHVVVSKYADHLPLYRQSRILERSGVSLSRTTLCGWVRDVADLVEPIVAEMKRDLLQSKVVNNDDIPIPVLDDSRNETRTGRLWGSVGDAAHPHIVFNYTIDRSRDGPLDFFAEFDGYLQVDAYSGYDPLFALGRATEVGCLAHVRRKFFDAQTTDPVRAGVALAWIHRLYEVEWEAKGRTAAERHALRQERSKPILERFFAWLAEQARVVLPKSPIGEAIGYALNQKAALLRYLEDGDLSIDNNAAERAVRGIAVGRKNWLFAGSDDGGRRAAILYSLIESCRRVNIDPFEYLRDVLRRIATHPARRIAELTPHGWARVRREEQARVAAEQEALPANREFTTATP